MDQNSGFTNIHMDAIREVGNIGTGNAATALSRLLGRTVDMDVPVAELVPIYEVAEHYGSPETAVCAILVRTEEGEFSCSLIFMIEEEKANMLADLIIPMDLSGMDEEARTQIRDSALSEQGNIILGAFLNALAQITGWVLPTTPAVAHDMLGSIMDLVASMFGVIGDSAMLVKTSLHIMDLDEELGGTVIMIPDPGSLETLLSKLGVL